MIAVFIDGAYLSICWRAISSNLLDFENVKSHIEMACFDRICETYYFDASDDGVPTRRHKAMEHCGYRVKLYDYAREPIYAEGGQRIIDPRTGVQALRRVQKGVDCGLVLNMLLSHRRRGWKKLVLAAGDRDFAEVVQHLVEIENVELITLGLAERTSHAILSYATHRIDLRKIAREVSRPLSVRVEVDHPSASDGRMSRSPALDAPSPIAVGQVLTGRESTAR